MKHLLLIAVFFLGIFSQTLRSEENLHRLIILFTNDVHGGIVETNAEFLNPEFPPMLGGGASAAMLIQKAREEAAKTNGSVLLMDDGDIFQGTLVGTRSRGKAVVEYMNRVGYDVCVPGNHDFDLGKENLIELIKMSNFPWVSCNIIDKQTGEVWEWVKPWVIIEKNGLRLGITGVTTAGTEYMSFPDNIKGLHFAHEIPSLQKAVNELRQNGADIIIAGTHSGLPYDPIEGYKQLKNTTLEEVMQRGYVNSMEIAHFVKGIDILGGGHLHRGYNIPWEDPVNHTICFQNYGMGGNLGWLNVYIDMNTKTIAYYDYPAEESTLLLLQEDEFWPDTTIYKFLKEQQAIYEKGFQEVIGVTQTALTRSSLGESPMNNLVTDAMRERVQADFAFTNFGGIRADLRRGSITRADIFRVLPFGNQVVVFKASGRFIKQIIEQKVRGSGRGLAISGGKVVINKTLPDGQRVVYMEIGGQPLDPEREYLVATTDYLMEGNSGLSLLTTVPEEKITYPGILLREAVIEYVQAHSPLNIKMDGRWRLDNSAQPTPQWLEKFAQPEVSSSVVP